MLISEGEAVSSEKIILLTSWLLLEFQYAYSCGPLSPASRGQKYRSLRYSRSKMSVFRQYSSNKGCFVTQGTPWSLHIRTTLCNSLQHTDSSTVCIGLQTLPQEHLLVQRDLFFYLFTLNILETYKVCGMYKYVREKVLNSHNLHNVCSLHLWFASTHSRLHSFRED